MTGGSLGSLVYSIKAVNTQFKSAMNENKQKIKQLDEQAEKSRRTMRRWGAAITAAAAALGAATLKMAADFQQSMAEVHTLLGPESEKRIQELGENVKQLSIDTGKDLTDLAQGAYQVVSAFGDGADTAKILEINAKAAAAGLATTNQAIALTSAVTKGYGDVSAETVQHTADLAFQTVRLGQIGPVAGQLAA